MSRSSTHSSRPGRKGDAIDWTPVTRKIKDLIPWEINPRLIKKQEAKRLAESLDQFNQVETIAIGPDNEVYNGHQRLRVWGAQYGPDLEVLCLQSSRPLSEDERKKLTVYLHRGTMGEWDFEILANHFDLENLLEWGFTEQDFHLADVDLGGEEDTPFAQFEPNEEDGDYVTFLFGDYRGMVERDIYDSFVREYQLQQEIHGEVMLSDVLRAWLDV